MAEAGKTVNAERVVIGGSVGCLIGAFAAAEAGAGTVLVLPPRGIGSGFAAREENGFRLDVGCRRLDLTSTSESAPVSAYRPGASPRPFAEALGSFLRDRIGLDLAPTPAPRLTYAGHFVDDFIASLDLSSLPHLLPPDQLKQVREETDAILAASPPDPLALGLGGAPNLSEVSLEEASLANHGRTFHHLFIEPFARKTCAQGWARTPADLASKIWTPLFYPRTLNQGCRGEVDRGRPAVTYYYPSSGYFGELVERTMERLEAHPDVEIVRAADLTSLENAGNTYRAAFADGAAFEWACPFALGISVPKYCELAGVPGPFDESALAIFWAEIGESDLLVEPALVNVFDPDTQAYRISFGGCGAREGRRIVTVELAGHSPECNEEGVSALLKRLGILAPAARIKEIAWEAGLKTLAPSAGNRVRLREAQAALMARGIEPYLIGTLNDMKADTLNEHVLQGMKFADVSG